MTVDPTLLDPINKRIIAELTENARLSVAELGRRVNLSAAAVGERIRGLERAKVITGYRAVISPRAIGYPVSAVIRVRPVMGRLHKIADVAREIPQVTECQRITGDDCYLMTVHLRDMDELEPILDRFAPFGQTTTSIVHSAPVPARQLPLD